MSNPDLPLIRLKIVKKVENFDVGETVNVNEKVAKFLLKNGYAIKSKDMSSTDFKTR